VPSGWKDYLDFLERSPYSLQLMTASLEPEAPIEGRRSFSIRPDQLGYTLFPFQQRILERIAGNALIVGLPTGLGKTYLAGAFIAKESSDRPARVLFLTPSVPLGIQQTLFARRMMRLDGAYFISGSIPPERRRSLNVWNAGFAVTTPQTFYNDVLSRFSSEIECAKRSGDPVRFLEGTFSDEGFVFPYDIVVADECHGYVGETDGYSVLLAAKADQRRILALSATPQLHAPGRLQELKRIFGQIETFSVEEPEIKQHMPERVIAAVPVPVPPQLIAIYTQLGNVVQAYQTKVKRAYGPAHLRGYCRRHPLCTLLLALRIMRFRLVEDGASSIQNYTTWKIPELNRPVKELGWKSICGMYRSISSKEQNHKFDAVMRLLGSREFGKAIIFIESVEAAEQLGVMLQGRYGMEEVAVLVGKGGMSMEQQASALIQFKERARILVCTSIGEEGLDIPAAEIEIWVDPPSNPKKWIQRFGRILRQSGGKKTAKTYALVSYRTHERNKLLGTKRRVERVYGFTQSLVEEPLPKAASKKGQERLTKYI